MVPNAIKERRESAQSLAIGSILRSREDCLHNYVFVVGALSALAGFYITFARGPMIALGYFAASATIFVIGLAEKKELVSRSLAVNFFLFANFVCMFCCSAIAQHRESTNEFHFALVRLTANTLGQIKPSPFKIAGAKVVLATNCPAPTGRRLRS